MVSFAARDSWAEDRPTMLINLLQSCQMDMVFGKGVGASECIWGPIFNRTHQMGANTAFQVAKNAQLPWHVAYFKGYDGEVGSQR